MRAIDESVYRYYQRVMFRAPFSFRGRIRRLEYGLTIVIACVVLLYSAVLADLVRQKSIYLAAYAGVLWFSLAQGCKRCHDLGSTGFLQIAPLYAFWMLFVDGQRKANRYGPSPKKR